MGRGAVRGSVSAVWCGVVLAVSKWQKHRVSDAFVLKFRLSHVCTLYYVDSCQVSNCLSGYWFGS